MNLGGSVLLSLTGRSSTRGPAAAGQRSLQSPLEESKMDNFNINSILKMLILRADANENKDASVTVDIDVDGEGSESLHHVQIVLDLLVAAVAAFISTVLDESAREHGRRE